VRTLANSVLWLGRKLLFLCTMALGTLMLLLLPRMLAYTPPKPPAKLGSYHLAAADWWHEVTFHLQHLWHGQILPPFASADQETLLPMIELARNRERFWQDLVRSWQPELLVTLKLVGSALVAGLVLGMLIGWLMSSLAPRWAQRPAWGLTTLLSCLPDMLIATLLDLGLVLLGMALGKRLVSADMMIYQQVIAPVLALALLITPYVARVTAAAIQEIGGQLYVRTAVAKGVHSTQVVVKHMGKPVLIQVWTALPVVIPMLISGTAIVEYIMELRGLGRALLLLLSPTGARFLPFRDPYAGALLLFPLLLLFLVLASLSELGLHKLDPRVGARTGGGEKRAWRGQPRFTLREWAQGLVRAPGAIGRTLLDCAGYLAQAVRALPGNLVRAIKALRDPVLLLGVLLVCALVAVAILAPRLAPYSADQVFKAYQDKSGHVFAPPFSPMATHLLGTDQLGRDVFSRLLYGTRYAMVFAALAAPARFLLALLLGMPAAWKGGLWSRVIDGLNVVFTAVPQVLLPLVLVNVANRLFIGNTPAAVAWGVALVALPGVPRLASSIRQQAEAVLAQPFLEGAVAAGAGRARTLLRHVLPHMVPQLIAMLVAEVPLVLTMTTTLAYFQVVPGGWIFDDDLRGMPALPEWGSMMEPPLLLIMSGRWWMWAPFAALFVAVVAFTMLGEGLRRRVQSRGEWGWEH
jgi:peptide/nickel transport system permease protein